jgi:hypothetical protein
MRCRLAGVNVGSPSVQSSAQPKVSGAFIPCPDNHAGDSRLTQEPVESQLRDTLSCFGSKRIERVNNPIQILFGYRRPLFSSLAKAAHFGQGLAAADLTCEPTPTKQPQFPRVLMRARCALRSRKILLFPVSSHCVGMIGSAVPFPHYRVVALLVRAQAQAESS